MSIIIFDTETTGLRKADITPLNECPYIVEFAGIKIDSKTFETIGTLKFLAKPGIEIPREVINIHHITNEMVENEKSFADKSSELEDFFKDCEMAVAHNIAFDKYMIDTEYRRLGKEFPWPSKLICTVNRTFSLFGYRLNLAKLHDHLFHRPFDGAHSAMGDTEALKNCFVKMIQDKIIEL